MPARPRPNVELVDIDSLRPHPRNPRQGDIGAIAEMIVATGWHTVVTVQRKARGRDVTLAGWHRSQALKALVSDGWTDPHTGERITYEELSQRVQMPPKGKVPIEPLHITDEAALTKLLADNRANDVASYDEAMLIADLTALAELDALDGTGYDGDDIDRMLRDARVEAIESRTGDVLVRARFLVAVERQYEDRLQAALDALELPHDVQHVHN